jgi:putative copper resistance protein D
MMDDLLLGGQVLCLSLVDCTLASLCGFLLAAFWTGRSGATNTLTFRPCLRWPALVLLLALGGQFWLLAIVMNGQSAPGAVLQSMPDVASTHAGRIIVWMLSLSVLLVAVTFRRLRGAGSIAQSSASVALITAILYFHAGLGHAAANGDFTSAELLQFLHLVTMAIWTGGVFVSAVLALPTLQSASGPAYAAYLRGLSNTSAVAATTAIVIGALKAWIAIDAKLGNLGQPGWSRILLAKSFFLCIALALGFLHRRKIHDRKCQWSAIDKKALVRTLRVETLCLALVIVLSAWLSNVEPPA